MEGKKILHLTLKSKWFWLIASGEKKEEYREIKPHWAARLEWRGKTENGKRFRDFDVVRFRLGYQKDAPQIDIECKGIGFGHANPAWADDSDYYYVIRLGKIISR